MARAKDIKEGIEFQHEATAETKADQKSIDVTNDSGRNNKEFQKIIQQMREAQKIRESIRKSSADDAAKKDS